MPHHKSCVKRLRKADEERVRNNTLKTILRRMLKEAKINITDGKAVDLNQAYAIIDRAAGRGVIPKKRASRIKSRLVKAAARVVAGKD